MKRIGIAIAGFLIIYIVGIAIINFPSRAPSSGNTTFSAPTPTGTTTSSKLQSEDIAVGQGKEAKTGDTVTVNYVGRLANGKQFDSSYDRKEPFSFTLGNGEVIKGWDQGVAGMKIGGKRRLTIPPELGYGDKAQGSIPANSTLIFEIELLEVKEATAPQPNLNF